MSPLILIVDDTEMNLKLAARVLEKDGYQTMTALNGKEALDKAVRQVPDLAILDVMMPEMDGYELCRQMRAIPELARIPIVMLTALAQVQDKLKAFDAGADDFLTKPFEPAELRARVKALLRFAESAPGLREERPPAYKLAVFSLRGGVGVSTLAANLAVGLTALWGEPSGLIDLALVNGQSALMLDLPLRTTWGDLAPIPTEELDADLIDQVMLRHANGTRVLAAPRRAVDADLIRDDKVRRVLKLVDDRFPYLILDLPHDFSDTTLAALDAADKILMPLSPEMASVRCTGMALDVFRELEYPPEKVELALNWTFSSQGLPRSEIEAALKKKLNVVIPHAPDTLVEALTLGQPPVLNAGTSPLGALLEDLAYYWSEPGQKKKRPATPTEVWQRVAERARQRAKQTKK